MALVESGHDGILKVQSAHTSKPRFGQHSGGESEVRSRLDAIPVPVLLSDNESSTVLNLTSIDYESNEEKSVSGTI